MDLGFSLYSVYSDEIIENMCKVSSRHTMWRATLFYIILLEGIHATINMYLLLYDMC